MKMNNKENDAQVINDLNSIKAQMSSISPIDYQRLMGEINNLIASNVDISPELVKSLEAMRSVVENHEKNTQALQMSMSMNDSSFEDKQARNSLNEFIENDIRTKELDGHIKEFQGFKLEFYEDLDDNNDLLKKLSEKKDLTKDENDRLNDRSNDEKLSKQWAKTYQIINDIEKCNEYAEKQINAIDQEIQHPHTIEERRKELHTCRAIHCERVASNQELLVNNTGRCIQAREEERNNIHCCVNNGDHDKVKHYVKRHCSDHLTSYKKEGNHKALHNMREMIMKCEATVDLQHHLDDINQHLAQDSRTQEKPYGEHQSTGNLSPDITPSISKVQQTKLPSGFGRGGRA